MTKQEFQQLLEKYEKGTCTPEEEKLLEQFLESYQQPLEKTLWSKQEQEEVGARIFSQVHQRISSSDSSAFRSQAKWIWWALAALVTGVLIYWAVRQFSEQKRTPAGEGPVIYASIETGAEEKKELKLSDGTLITLNEHSVLKYPKTFLPTGARKVELRGEAFFEVAKDSLRPFIAHSGTIETVVLGTAFNIDARPESEEIEVALVEGKVQVLTSDQEELEILNPNEKIVFSKKNKTTQKSSFQGNLTYAWKEVIILFEKASVREVVEVLSEKYDTVFQIEDEGNIESLLVYRVDTQKYLLSQVLEHIARVTDYQFTKNADGSITVKPK